jgi:Rha family phage regulatory protein
MEALVLLSPSRKDVTTSLIVAEVFGKQHGHVLRDIENLSCSDSFRLSNFGELYEIKQLPNNGSRKDPYYEITKDGFSFLVMGYTGEKAGEFKEKFITEFNKREALLKNDDFILARALEISARKMKAIELELKKQLEQNELQEKEIKDSAPKVKYHDMVLQSKSMYNTTQIAKELGMSAKTLNEKLRARQVQYKQNGTWVLYHQFQDKGYTKTKTFAYVDSHGNPQTSMQTEWTEAGREFIHKIMNPSLKPDNPSLN